MTHYIITASSNVKYPRGVRYIGSEPIAAACSTCRRKHVYWYRQACAIVDKGKVWPDILAAPCPFIVNDNVRGIISEMNSCNVEFIDMATRYQGRGKLGEEIPSYYQVIPGKSIAPNVDETIGVRTSKSVSLPLCEHTGLCPECALFEDCASFDANSISYKGINIDADIYCWNIFLFVSDKLLSRLIAGGVSNLAWNNMDAPKFYPPLCPSL